MRTVQYSIVSACARPGISGDSDSNSGTVATETGRELRSNAAAVVAGSRNTRPRGRPSAISRSSPKKELLGTVNDAARRAYRAALYRQLID